MQKIVFNDRYGLTDAVIEGRKTRATQIMAGIDFPVNMVMGRVLPDKDGKIYAVANGENIIVKLRYKVGEIVAVAQCYNDVVREFTDLAFVPGSTNKMFVRADLMPHQIRITGIRCERLQDISDEDCMREGVRQFTPDFPKDFPIHPTHFVVGNILKNTPREAFAALIDRTCGRGTWERNPWVVAYEFELVK